MGVQDKTEEILRAMHVLVAQSPTYEKDENKAVIDKKELIDLLKRLNASIYDVMDTYEQTKNSRERAERESSKKKEEILLEANRKAEDVYAASMLYTDDALKRVLEIMKNTSQAMESIYEAMNSSMEKEMDAIYRNKLDVKGHLQDLSDTQYYLKLLEGDPVVMEEKLTEAAHYAGTKTEIKMNPEFFSEGELAEIGVQEEEKKVEAPEVRVNLSSEYFRQKAQQEQNGELESLEDNFKDEIDGLEEINMEDFFEKKEGKHSILGSFGKKTGTSKATKGPKQREK